MYQARGSMVQTGSWKVACFFVGPLIIFEVVGPNQFLLMSLDGQIYPHLIEETRLKPETIRTSKGNVIGNVIDTMRKTESEVKKTLSQYQDDFLMFGKYSVKSLKTVINTLNSMHDKQTELEK